MTSRSKTNRRTQSPWMGGLCVLLVTLFCSLAIQGILQSETSSGRFLSRGLWERLVEFLSGRVVFSPEMESFDADPSFWRIFFLNAGSSLVFWTLGGWLISRQRNIAYPDALGHWGVRGWCWGLIPAVWELGRIFSSLIGPASSIAAFLYATGPLWMSVALAGWLATFDSFMEQPNSEKSENRRRAFYVLCGAVLVYVAIFTAMNWQLYRNLLVPHGDSAMYEEHLWNLTHGKGFRSFQEDRLFLGEHLQVVHLLLLPFHALWPSLMMLDLSESLALASGAFPIYWMTTRHTGSSRAGLCVAAGYLLYYPMQYLDIAIDLKTFRPVAFGVPLMLYGLDQYERGRIKTALAFWLIALSAKEDYAIILAPLGLWIAFTPSPGERLTTARRRILGISVAVFSTSYLGLAVRYIIPWFRGGEEVHYVGYFSQFGSSLEEVVKNILGNPRLLLSELFGVNSWIYVASLLVPLGGMALFSPGRLLVGLPLFGILCLNQIDNSPQHHFHAPLVAVLFWATAAGVSRFPRAFRKTSQSDANNSEAALSPHWAGWFVLMSAFVTGLFFSMGPLGIGFWDPDSPAYWKNRYVISERAEKFALVYDQIPKSARVFSTDFVHPRFTHHARSYDYSSYDRKSDEELTNPVPGETYYIVIDTKHYYSKIKTPNDIPEYRQHPEDWELLPDKTDGYYIVLKRRSKK